MVGGSGYFGMVMIVVEGLRGGKGDGVKDLDLSSLRRREVWQF